MQRRTFLNGLLLGGFACAWQTARAAGMTMDHMAMDANEPESAVPLLAPDVLPAGAPLRDLPRLTNQSSQPGLFRATLTAAPHAFVLLPGMTTDFWAYNGSVPGPLIEVFEGDTVEITLINRLTQPTTIHWHGLPVPPEQDGNPQQQVAPGASRTYRFTLPAGSAGTYWYHPHPHGHTAEQVYRGLAGAFLVRARQDPLAGIPERLLLMSDLKLAADGRIAPNDADDRMNGREGQFVLVNGQQRPVLNFAAGGRERWRIWNACSARYLRLQLPDSTFTLVGTDGGLIEHPQPGLPELLLAPAQRVELIVDAGARRDRGELIATVYGRGKMGKVAPERPHSLLTVDFAGVGAVQPPALPERLNTIVDLGPAAAKKRVVFGEEMSMAGGRHSMRFLVNGRQFAMRRIDLSSRAGQVELWELVNQADMDHPFHLHGTQFQVVEREYGGVTTPEPFLAWRDTVNLRAGETVRIKTVQYQRGVRMFHCHIIEHEEAGMMGQLRVL
jgi:bilirubin oxidase